MIEPMLCKISSKPFSHADWIWERKLDGFRALAIVSLDSYQLFSRSGEEKTDIFPELDIRVKHQAILDGEVISATGLPFQEGIQPRVNRIHDRGRKSVELPAMYMVFDIIEIDRQSLIERPLGERKQTLNNVLITTSNTHNITWNTDGVELYNHAKAEHWEGIVGKNLLDKYEPGKRRWLKIKCWQQDTFYAIGYTPGTGKRFGMVGSLHLYNDGMEYVGDVGTGFDDNTLEALTNRLIYNPAEVLKLNIKYLEFTNDGKLRFPVYLGEV